MALSDILQKIRSLADQEIEQLQKDFDAKKQNFSQELAAEYEAKAESLEAETTASVAKSKELQEARARQVAAREKNLQQREILDRAIQALLDHLAKSDDAAHKSIFEPLLKGLTGSGEILVPKGKKGLIESLAPKGYTVKEDGQVSSGLVVVSENSKIDYTFENLVRSEFQEEVEIYLSKQLNFI